MKNNTFLWLAVICVVLIIVVLGLGWLRAEQSDQAGQAAGPQSLVTTFKGDPQTSRAFTWYSNDPKEKAIVQLVKGEDAQAFDGENVITIEGTTTSMDIGNGQHRGSHKVEATGLDSGTTYTYRVGNGEEKGWSAANSFQTEAEGTEEFVFLNVADSQGVTEQDFKLWENTLNKAFETFPAAQFIVHNGDLIEDPLSEQAWTQFFANAQKWLSRVPLMTVTGNHDEIDNEAGRYVSHFNLPTNGAAGSIPGTTYSFDYGPVHFVILNSESNLKEQKTWLENDLASTDKKWKVVAMHRGPYGGNSYKKTMDWVEIIDEYGVDLVLQGHNHEYARSYPLRNGKIVGDGDAAVNDREGTVYVVTNTSGQKFNEKKEDKFYHKVHFQNEKQMFAGITVNRDTMTYQAYDVDGAKLDEFVLKHGAE